MTDAAVETPAETPAPSEVSLDPTPKSDSAPAEEAQEKSLGEGGGSQVETPAPSTWPEDWRQRFAGSDEKLLKRLNRYKDPSNIVKSWLSAEQKLSSGEYRKAKPETDDEEAIKAWREEVGIPETHEGYFENLSEDFQVDEKDKPYVEGYFKRMHELGVPPKEASEGLKVYYSMLNEAQEKRAETDRQFRAEAEDKLRSEWGPEYRANLNAMHSLFDTHGPEGLRELLFTARMADGTPLGDHPDVLQFLAGVSRELNPFGTVTPNDGQTQSQTVQKRLAELRAEMNDTRGNDPEGYWKSEAKQAEFRRLLELEEKFG